MKNMKKILVLALAALLLVAVSVAGTVAYLTATTTPVTNTFSPANIDLELKETLQSDGSDLGTADWKGQLIPGATLKKDPKVTVTYDVACYVFIKVDETNWNDDIATYTIADGWTELSGNNGLVWYKEFAQPTQQTTEEILVIKDNQITVKDVGKTELDGLYVTKGGVKTAKDIKLVFTAYACQKANGTSEFSAAEAWAKVAPTTP